jgi:predicted RNase H-like HicB family nuclease/DNA-binding XRE family transcriptional regulator
MFYPAIITKEGEFTLAEFPDCEGCQTFVRKGESIEEAAKEALELWLDVNLGRDAIPNRPGTVKIARDAKILEIPVSFALAFRLELRWAREEAKKTQAQFGKKLGMSQQQYARLEGPGSNPTLGTVDRVARVTGLGVMITKASDHSRVYSVKTPKGDVVIGTHSKAAGRSEKTVPSRTHEKSPTRAAARRR